MKVHAPDRNDRTAAGTTDRAGSGHALGRLESNDLTLFAFHHAGGGMASFSGWQRRLGTDVRIAPVSLPGRTDALRWGRTDVTDVIDALDATLDGELDRPHAFYGHSMGALLAYALARRRYHRGRQLPQCLLVGAARAPHARIPDRLASIEAHQLGALLPGALRQGGAGEHLALRMAKKRLLRADLRLCRSAAGSAVEPLPCPIATFIGRNDPFVSLAEIEQWARYTTRYCRTYAFDGGHFFYRDTPTEFFQALSGELRSVVVR